MPNYAWDIHLCWTDEHEDAAVRLRRRYEEGVASGDEWSAPMVLVESRGGGVSARPVGGGSADRRGRHRGRAADRSAGLPGVRVVRAGARPGLVRPRERGTRRCGGRARPRRRARDGVGEDPRSLGARPPRALPRAAGGDRPAVGARAGAAARGRSRRAGDDPLRPRRNRGPRGARPARRGGGRPQLARGAGHVPSTAPRLSRPRLRCQGLLAAARGDADAAHRCVRGRPRASTTASTMPFERARTLLALGGAERRAKRKRAAREALDGALAAFEDLGAALWAREGTRPSSPRSAGGLLRAASSPRPRGASPPWSPKGGRTRKWPPSSSSPTARSSTTSPTSTRSSGCARAPSWRVASPGSRGPKPGGFRVSSRARPP